MLFNSLEFLVFFPLVIMAYFALPGKWRWPMLLGASYYFYMSWKAEYLILILVSTGIDYVAGLQLGRAKTKGQRNLWLALSLASNLGILGFFKYWNFFSNSTREALQAANIFVETPLFDYLLPVGISFYTFQTLSYTIDVYKGKKQPERHLGIFALYVAFWPQLVAGPIERSVHLMPQFKQTFQWDWERIKSGLLLMLWGFFKKVVVADRMAAIVDPVYNHPADHQGLGVWVATYAFAFQIYCDFSAYSDIAIGASRVMGYDLMVNFRKPYFSKNISEFWRRWHISLSTWFRDYLYIPLGGNRVATWRYHTNLFIVFLVSGLWHGANWTFVVWGALHGFYLVFSLWTQRFQTWLMGQGRIINAFITFHLACFAWIFFRANNVQDAFVIIQNLNGPFDLSWLDTGSDGLINYASLAIGLPLLLLHDYLDRDEQLWNRVLRLPTLPRWSVYLGLLFLILLLGYFRNPSQFIYFQF